MMHNINTGYLQAEIRCDTDAEQCSAAEEEEDGKMFEQAPLLILCICKNIPRERISVESLSCFNRVVITKDHLSYLPGNGFISLPCLVGRSGYIC